MLTYDRVLDATIDELIRVRANFKHGLYLDRAQIREEIDNLTALL